MRKSILSAALASVMMIACAATASAERVTADKTYDGLVVDGSAGWNSGGSGETFAITEGGVTVTFDCEPFVRDAEWYSNFVFETIATDAAAGITLRADAWAWTYGDEAGNVPTWSVVTSWGDSWDAYVAAAPGEVELTMMKTAADTVTASIVFAGGTTEEFTVTYPDGVPDGLEFQVGADGGIITLKSATFGGDIGYDDDDDFSVDDTDTDTGAADTDTAPADTGAAGSTSAGSADKGSPDTGVNGMALFAGLAIAAAGAAVVSSRKKGTK